MIEKSEAIISQRQIRVFVSSTFRDMHEDRDYLVKFVFPQLRKLCEDRSVTWGEVDLRWGITDEQAAEGQVLPLCLDEIEHCRPYFIGILGERYGWVPNRNDFSELLLESQPWLVELLDRSVTELEIIHGVFGRPLMREQAYFYFRDPNYAGPIEGKYDQSEFQSESSAGAEKLSQLKQRIRNYHVADNCSLRENYRTVEQLGEWIFDDFHQLIDRLYPESEEVDSVGRQSNIHDSFAVSRRTVHIGRDSSIHFIDTFVEQTEQSIVILGDSGIGKSSLLADWSARYRQSHPDDAILVHFVQASDESSNWQLMLKRFMERLKTEFALSQNVPDDPDQVRAAFGNWLNMASAKAEEQRRQIVLVIDALDQLDDRDGARHLAWLPTIIPKYVRLILSTNSGVSEKELLRRGWHTHSLGPLEVPDRIKLVNAFLGQHAKSLSEHRVLRIVNCRQAGNPLFLTVLLGELRLCGVHEELDQRLSHYLSSETISSLYERILDRFEEDYDVEKVTMVRDTMSLIWASRRGLSEAEILDLLGSDGLPLPHRVWTPLYLAAKNSLSVGSGLLNFANDHFRQAVQSKYLSTAFDQRAAHLRLALYFHSCVSDVANDHYVLREMTQQVASIQGQKPSEVPIQYRNQLDESTRKSLFAVTLIHTRGFDEIPWQYVKCQAWRKLYDLLSDELVFAQACKFRRHEVKEYWRQIEASSNLRLVDAYHTIIASPNQYIVAASELLKLLIDTDKIDHAAILCEGLLVYYRESVETQAHVSMLIEYANISIYRGDDEQALATLNTAEQLLVSIDQDAMQLKNQAHFDNLASVFLNKSDILYRSGDLENASVLIENAENSFRTVGRKFAITCCIGRQANVQFSLGNLTRAEALSVEEELASREQGDLEGVVSALLRQGEIREAQGRLDEALTLYQEAELTAGKLGQLRPLYETIVAQARILRNRGDLRESLAELKRVELLCIDLVERKVEAAERWLPNVLGIQGILHKKLNDLDGALMTHQKQESICRRYGNESGLAIALSEQGSVLVDQGVYQAALAKLRESEQIYRKLGHDVSIGLRSNVHRFERLLQRQLNWQNVAAVISPPSGLANNLFLQGTIVTDYSIDDALKLFEEVQIICREIGDNQLLLNALYAHYRIVSQQRDFDAMRNILPQLGEVCETVGDLQTQGIVQAQRSLLCHERIVAGTDFLRSCQFHKAERCFCEAIEIDPDSAEAWWCRGQAYAQMGRYQDEIMCCDRTIEIRPDYPEAWSMKAAACIALERNDDALQCSVKAIQLNPELVTAWMNKGASLLGLKRPREAFQCFREAKRLGHPRAADGMLHCQQLLDELDSAI